MEVTDKVITLDCGCSVPITLTFQRGELGSVQGSLNFCKLHAAARALLSALEAVINFYSHPDPHPVRSGNEVIDQARDAIELAKGN